MGISIFKKANTSIEQIDIKTGFNLWSLLVARYESMESAQMFRNFVHDRDLDLVLDSFIHSFNKQIEALEKEAESLQLLTPRRPALDIKTSAKVDEITDKYIFKRSSTDMLVEMSSLTQAVRTTLTSDRLRKLFTEFLYSHLNQYESLYKYGKLKGWVEISPAYKTTKQQAREKLSVSDAFHVWDHIQRRYNQLHITKLYEGIAHDTDFRAVMALATRTLEGQLTKLEKLAIEFEVTLPERPPESMRFAVDPEVMDDRLFFQQINDGIDMMVEAHIRSCIETLRNDRVRGMFVHFLEDELDIHDKMIKYGKLKGWLIVPPVYAQGTVG